MHLELNNSVNSNLFVEQDTANSFIPLYCTVLKSEMRQTLRLIVFKDIEENENSTYRYLYRKNYIT